MKLLLLTSFPHIRFVFREASKYLSDEDIIVWADDSPYDWLDDYDLGISFMYPYKVPKNQLHKTQINFHPGPLPRYKGRNLCYVALFEGATEFGATVHYMNENFDDGDIIEVREFPIRPGWCADDLSDRTLEEAKDLFRDYLPKILTGEEFPRIKNEGGMYYGVGQIDEFLYLSEDVEDRIRAISYKKFYPKINIGGTIFKVVRE